MTISALGSGLAGAATLTLLHETVRRINPDAPRMDVLGRRAIAQLMRRAGETPPDDQTLQPVALLGDVISNALYYSLVGAGRRKNAWLRGVLLGTAAGLGGVFLPGPLGLGKRPSGRTFQTKAMTVAWYLAGGLVAAATYRGLKKK
ncbi:MAG: hypothetical protein H7Z75_17080 [Ferruginibacter sp.]|nr:hypothetical protein [Cytophagales bacterium]